MEGEALGDYSGNTLAMSHDGTVVAIGAHGNDDGGSNAGHVRVYALNGNSWVQRGVDIDGAFSNNLGRSVALNADGTKLVIGIPNKASPSGDAQAGVVRVLVWNGVSWSQRGIEIVGETAGDQSGWSVDISDDGTVVAIGAHRNDDAGSNAGHVRVYRWFGGNWVQRGGDMDGEALNDYSGFDVSCNAACSVVAIGAYGNDDAGSMAGQTRVYIYSSVLNAWARRGSDIDGVDAGDTSGKAVALNSDGNTLVIGATIHDGDDGAGGTITQSGLVRVYTWDSASSAWTQQGSDIFGDVANAWNGASVAVNADGSTIAMGASRGTNENGAMTGQVKIYTWDGATSAWIVNAQSLFGEGAADYFGNAVALSSDGKTVCVGAYFNDNAGGNAGSVQVYKLP